jgi:hypothetical protein
MAKPSMAVTSIMIIGHRYVLRAGVGPAEAESELIIDPNGVLSGAVPRQWVQPVARRRFQIIQRNGIVEQEQFALRRLEQIGRKTLWRAAICDGLRSLVPDRSDHRRILS